VGTSPDAWLFGTASGSVLSARNLQRAWKKARDVAGVPHLRLHDLRHMGLTWVAVSRRKPCVEGDTAPLVPH
jgi:integrase